MNKQFKKFIALGLTITLVSVSTLSEASKANEISGIQKESLAMKDIAKDSIPGYYWLTHGGNWLTEDYKDLKFSIADEDPIVQQLWRQAQFDWNNSSIEGTIRFRESLLDDSKLVLSSWHDSNTYLVGLSNLDPEITSSPFSSGLATINTIMIEENYPYNKIRSVVNHELGHILGLAHPMWTDVPVLMNPFIDTVYDFYGIYLPTEYDLEGVTCVYQFSLGDRSCDPFF